MNTSEPRIETTKIKPGEHHGKELVGQTYEIKANNETIGYVRRNMLTRERRGAGMRYVYARWESPGWEYSKEPSGRYLECGTKKAGIENLVFDWQRKKSGDHW